MKKINCIALAAVLSVSLLASCSEKNETDTNDYRDIEITVSDDSKEEIPEEEEETTTTTTAVPEDTEPVTSTTPVVEIPDKYTSPHNNYRKRTNNTVNPNLSTDHSEHITEATTTTTKVTTSYHSWETNQVFPKNGNPNSINHYDYYPGPFTWEGVNVKFDCPENYYLTLNFEEVPILFSPDKVSDPDSVAECGICFFPYQLQLWNMENMDSMTEDYFAKGASGSNIFRYCQLRMGTKNNDDGVNLQNAKYEKTNEYTIYTYEYHCNVEDVDTIITKFQMANGTLMIAQVKKGSDYEKHYLDDMKTIAKSFEYSDIPYVP